MDNQETFYYDILNINKKQNQLNIIEKIVKKNMEEIKYIDGFCKVISNNIAMDLKFNNIAFKIINTKELSFEYEHEFIISYYKKENSIEYVLVDPSYKQFIQNSNNKLYKYFNEWPSKELEKTIGGLKLSKNLINNGFSIIDENDLLNYLNMFSNEIRRNDFNIDKLIIKNNIN